MLSKLFGDRPSLVPLLLRIGIGLTFIFAGLGKVPNYPVQYFTSLGIPLPQVMAPFIGWLELLGGVAILLGVLTRPVALLLACDMLVAILMAKLGGQQGLLALGLPAGWGAVRVELLLLLGCLALMFSGAGQASIDRNVLKREVL